MAIRNTSWHRIEPGQIVSFVYKSQNEKRGYKRTVLVINPDWKYRKKSTGRIKRYVVGLVLDTAIAAPLTIPKLNRLLGVYLLNYLITYQKRKREKFIEKLKRL